MIRCDEIERAREQQGALRDALRALQDSLRQRVLSLGLSFGQTAISTAETAARKQLEAFHLSLARKLEIRDRHTKGRPCSRKARNHFLITIANLQNIVAPR